MALRMPHCTEVLSTSPNWTALRTRAGVWVALVALLALPSTGLAWHEDDAPVTEFSARTLRDGELRIYPTTLIEYGLSDTLHVGTMPGAYLLRTPNVSAKWNFWRSGEWSAAASAGIYYTNLQFFSELQAIVEELPDVGVAITPIGGHLSWYSGNLGLHANLFYFTINTLGEFAGQDVDADIRLDVSTVRLMPVLEWRRSRSFAWVFELNVALAQIARGGAKAVWTSPDGRTTVEIFGDGNVEFAADQVNNLSVSGYWSWKSFNLRLGLGYGSVDIPFVGLFLGPPVPKLPFPEANLYWRF